MTEKVKGEKATETFEGINKKTNIYLYYKTPLLRYIYDTYKNK